MRLRTIGLVMIIMATLFLFGCNTDSTETDTEQIQVTITLLDEVNDSTIAEDEIIANKGEVLQDVLEENYEVEVQQGGFITSIEGHAQNESENIYWVFEVNEEMVNESASSYELQDEDHVVFKLMQFE